MTKAKNAKGSAEEKTAAKSANTKVKAAPKAAKKTTAKPKAEAAPKKTAAKPVAEAKPAKAAKPAVEKKKGDTEIIVRPAPAAPAAAFSNSGLGVKTASKKPALSVAPGVMILGKVAPVKNEQVARPSDRRLSKKEQQEIKDFLLEKRERLLAGMRRELQMQKERAESKAADEVDKATDAYDEDLSFEIATANDQELEDIQVALEKIERGTYGECEICGCGISPSRLKILPSATTCVYCRGQEEMSRHRDDGSPGFSIIGDDADTESELL